MMDADLLYVGNGEDWKDLRRELRERFKGRCRIHFLEEGDDAALLLTFQQFKVAVLIVESVVKSYPNDDGLEYSQGLRTDGYRGVIILLTERKILPSVLDHWEIISIGSKSKPGLLETVAGIIGPRH